MYFLGLFKPQDILKNYIFILCSTLSQAFLQWTHGGHCMSPASCLLQQEAIQPHTGQPAATLKPTVWHNWPAGRTN